MHRIRTLSQARNTVRLFMLLGCTMLAGFLGGCGQESRDTSEAEGVSPDHSVQAVPASVSGKVLLVHSYHREYEWVAGITRGVRRVLKGTDVELELLYMDTKRKTDEAWKQEAGRIALATVEAWQPDVVIAVDDNAQAYMARHLIGRDKPKIVYCGVNADPADYGYPATNVTGVLERPHFDASLRFMQKIYPRARRVALLSDDSPTSAGALKYMEGEYPGFEIVSSQTASTFDDWKQKVTALQNQADVIAVYMYHTLKRSGSKESVIPREVMEWTVNNSRLPLAGLFTFAVDDGMLCGIVESGVEHGVEAGQMALEILKGTPAAAIPSRTASEALSMINLGTARRLGVDLPDWIVDSVDIVIGAENAS